MRHVQYSGGGVSREGYTIVVQPRVGQAFQCIHDFQHDRQCAFFLQLDRNDLVIHEYLTGGRNEFVKDCLCSAVRIALKVSAKQTIQVMRQYGHDKVKINFNHNT